MKSLLPVLLLIWGACLPGQAMRIEYFTVTDGLSTRDINGLHIGKDGYLWVATMDGLNRFDGHTFVSFGQGLSKEPKLSRGSVESIRAGNDGKLILTYKEFYGVFDRFDPRDFSVERVPLSPSEVIGFPRTIVTDDLGRTFFVTIGEYGTVLYEYTQEGFQVIYQDTTDEWNTITSRVELKPLSNGQFIIYDEDHGFRHLSANGELLNTFFPRLSSQRRFYVMEEGPAGYVYLSFRDGIPLYRYDPDRRGSASPVGNLDLGLRYPKVFKDGLGQLLFVGTEDILGKQFPDEYYLVDTSGTFALFERDLPIDRSVTSIAAINFNETVYLGLREGLGVTERYVKSIHNYLEDTEGELYRKSVRGITEDADGTVYIAQSDGTINAMARGTYEMNPLRLVDSSGTVVPMRENGQLIFDRPRNAVWGVAQPSGYAKGGLLFRYDVATGVTTSYGSVYSLTCLAVAPDGKLYVGATDPRKGGLLLEFDPTTARFTERVDADQEAALLDGVRINYLLYSRKGELLLGTRHDGLIGYDPATSRAQVYQVVTRTGESAEIDLNAITINCIFEDTGGRWWLGTDAGLRVYNTIEGNVERYERQDGLSNNTVVGLVPDSTGGYWVSTRNGLVHLPKDLANGTFRRYYQEDGLANDEFNRYCFHRDNSGRYFFGGDNGLSVFRDDDLSVESAGSDVMLTEVVVYGRGETRSMTQNLDGLKNITVNASEKSIAVSFALPVGQRPSLTQFRVKLDGFNETWQRLRNERTVRYNNLPSGQYTLMVQGAGANGNYGEKYLSLNIRVRQYLIEKTWFQFLIATVIVGLFFFILQAKLRERLRNEQLRTQLSSDIHDEVSGLLAGITLQAELLQHRTDDEKLRIRLQTVGEAGRNAMSKMSDVIWSIDSRRDNVGNLLQRMQEHADEVLLPLDIRYDFRASGFVIEQELPGNVRQDLYFIYKEAVNNIARHSDANYVEIELEQYAQTFEMFIRDNGSGKKKDANPTYSSSRFTPKTGQGKDNMRMRAQRLRAELTIDDRAGYTLTLRMRRLT
ncbi:ligand-binding sensor domain-containing protein [Neolewinella xylanilytica]|uniref:ligand-binding sensor domain-containing protein n=1 Tax=Neolewinella xylanilytica TaxID=1514080 RepID=UPI001475F0B2|nr:sensor histidine kinase [Neolewinella xylanilytica]